MAQIFKGELRKIVPWDLSMGPNGKPVLSGVSPEERKQLSSIKDAAKNKDGEKLAGDTGALAGRLAGTYAGRTLGVSLGGPLAPVTGYIGGVIGGKIGAWSGRLNAKRNYGMAKTMASGVKGLFQRFSRSPKASTTAFNGGIVSKPNAKPVPAPLMPTGMVGSRMAHPRGFGL